MAVWDELKVVLGRLRDEQPGTLMQYPMPEVDEGRQPPYIIPPGDWGTQATLTLGPHPRDSPRKRTPVLPLTITA
jgi:hypothetical protein